jgi:hypothetical protein
MLAISLNARLKNEWYYSRPPPLSDVSNKSRHIHNYTFIYLFSLYFFPRAVAYDATLQKNCRSCSVPKSVGTLQRLFMHVIIF